MNLTEILLQRHSIISEQIGRESLEVVLSELEKVLERVIAGDVVEFGCYIGTTSLFIRRVLDEAGESDKRAFHVYDSFEGLPAKTMQDASIVGSDFKAGELKVSKRQFLREFKRAKLVTPVIHKGWFNELGQQDVPEHIAFAFLDGDFYESISQSLKLVWPRLSPGGVVTIDDYNRETLPGVERAVHNFFQGKVPPIRVTHNISVIRKLQ